MALIKIYVIYFFLATFALQSCEALKPINGPSSENSDFVDGTNIEGRKIIHREYASLKSSTSLSGDISFDLCIDRKGHVTTVTIIEEETTIRDPIMKKQALESLKKYRYEPNKLAPEQECGKYLIKIDTVF